MRRWGDEWGLFNQELLIDEKQKSHRETGRVLQFLRKNWNLTLINVINADL